MTRAREGFSLIEVMVAMTILSIVLVSLAKLSTIVAVRGRDSDLIAKRTAALQLEENKFGATTDSAIALWTTGSKAFTVGDFSYTRTLTITKQSSTRYTIKIVISPTTAPGLKDSVTLDRTAPATTTALCTGC